MGSYEKHAGLTASNLGCNDPEFAASINGQCAQGIAPVTPGGEIAKLVQCIQAELGTCGNFKFFYNEK